MDKLELNTRAQELREKLGEDIRSPIDIFAAAARIDRLTLIFYPMGKHISSMCEKDGDLKLIAVNSSMSLGRQRFSLAHELYHLTYDDPRSLYICAQDQSQKSETERCADQFASYFLSPYRSLRDRIISTQMTKPLSLKNVIDLEQYFGMSHQAMLWRLFTEGYISRPDMEKMSAGVASAAKKLGYDGSLYHSTPSREQKKTFGYYLVQTERLREKNLVSDGKINELLLDAYREDLVYGEGSKGRFSVNG